MKKIALAIALLVVVLSIIAILLFGQYLYRITQNNKLTKYVTYFNNHKEIHEGTKYIVRTPLGYFTVYKSFFCSLPDEVYDHDIFAPNGKYLGYILIENERSTNERGEIELSILKSSNDITIYTDLSRQVLIWKTKIGDFQFVDCGAIRSLPKSSIYELMPCLKYLSQHNWYWFTQFAELLCSEGDKPTMSRLCRYAHGKFTKELRSNGDDDCGKNDVISFSQGTLSYFKTSGAGIYTRIIHSRND